MEVINIREMFKEDLRTDSRFVASRAIDSKRGMDERTHGQTKKQQQTYVHA
jgi:hypothetical protein